MFWNWATPIITAIGLGYCTLLGVEYIQGKTLREKMLILKAALITTSIILGIILITYAQQGVIQI